MNIPPSLDEVLKRVSSLIGANTDKSLAEGLGVSPQTLSTWKRRNTIPYERLIQFALDQKISLDELLLGKSDSSSVDPTLFVNIFSTLIYEGKKLPTELILPVIGGGSGGLTVEFAAMIYNRVVKQLKHGKNWTEIIDDEVKYFIDLKKRGYEGEVSLPAYPEKYDHKIS